MLFKFDDYLPDFTTETEIKDSLKRALGKFFNCNHVILVVNGTTAIEIALKALGLKRGTPVIVPDLSFIATATAVANCGLIPVYADISAEYYGLTLESVKQEYTQHQNTGAVVLVHFGGYVNREIFAIKAFCAAHHLYLLEDCAQAFPCSSYGEMVGTIGDVGTFSLQSSKIVNCGEGGIITTNSALFARNCEAISNWGLSSDTPPDRNLPSGNFRLSAVQSYFVLKQLPLLKKIVSQRLSRSRKWQELFRQYHLETAIPPQQTELFDCPFFFPVKSRQKLHTLEPRGEYPMRRSTMVPAILGYYYPDLLTVYLGINAGYYDAERTSDKVLREIDFINFHHCDALSGETIIDQYVNNG